MTAGTETLVIDEWLLEVLDGITDVTGVYEALAPVDAPYPFIVFQYMSGSDTIGVGPAARIMIDSEYLVRVIGDAPFTTLKTIADAIDAALDGQRGTTSTGVVLGVARREQYRETEQYESQHIRHLGGRYRIVAQGT